MNGLQLYRRYVAASIRAQMQFPASFLMLSFSQFFATITEFFGIWILFRRFGQIAGWTFGEIAVFYAVVSITFAVADSISRGFDIFGPEFVKTGNFDRLLLRPRATALQLLGHELRLTRMGRLLQGLLVLAIAANLVQINFGVANLILLFVTLAGGTALFVGILVLQATLAFWTVESLEIANTLTYGGVEAAEYPLDIYTRWFRDFLIFVVPIGCVVYFPVVRMLGRSDRLGAPDWLLAISPMVGFLFLAGSLAVWRFGERHYTSTGS
ncbi:MAG TPA: ABC-2 family transporter protein [Candidatus Binataceae bacterium]